MKNDNKWILEIKFYKNSTITLTNALFNVQYAIFAWR